MHFDVVVNPAGASGRTKKYWMNKVEPLFRDADYTVHYSTVDHGISDICRELTETGDHVNLVIVGGDGTMNDAVNGIADFSNVSVGLIPCGSGNDLARDLPLKKDLRENVASILSGKVTNTIDLGEVVYHNRCCIIDKKNNTYDNTVIKGDKTCRFIISAGAGFDAETCVYVQVSKMKKLLNRIHLGKLIYITVAAKLIFRMEKFSCTMTTERKTLTFPRCMFTVAMNHKYEGGGFKFCPDADDKDGMLDLCTAGDFTRGEFFKVFPSAYSGSHEKYAKVYPDRAEYVRIQTDRPVWIHTDGEPVCKSDDFEFRILNQKMNMLI